MVACESPLGEGWRPATAGRATTAVVQRRGGFFVDHTHPEAFGFCPSQEGIDFDSNGSSWERELREMF